MCGKPDGASVRQRPNWRVAARREVEDFKKGAIIGVLHDRVPQNFFAGFNASVSGKIVLFQIAIFIVPPKWYFSVKARKQLLRLGDR
jgi:hypothetical protein